RAAAWGRAGCVSSGCRGPALRHHDQADAGPELVLGAGEVVRRAPLAAVDADEDAVQAALEPARQDPGVAIAAEAERLPAGERAHHLDHLGGAVDLDAERAAGLGRHGDGGAVAAARGERAAPAAE